MFCIRLSRKPAVKTIVLIGTLDTKGVEYEYIKRCIEEKGCKTLVIDAGILDTPFFQPDVTRTKIARLGGSSIGKLVEEGDRGRAVKTMSRGVEIFLSNLYSKGHVDGVIALGGGGGTSIACSGMRALPFGIPKVMVSTLAGRDVSGYVGIKDIVMMPSIVDISGINSISRDVFRKAAAAVCAMAEETGRDQKDKKLIAATMFGNTTPAITNARKILESTEHEVAIFPCSGTSGKVMEDLICSDRIAGVLDITTTELADEIAGGVLSAGPNRLEAASKNGIPQVVVPGCLDMVNFWEPETIPVQYRDRKFYRHNQNITLMRTNIEENRMLGEIIARKLNMSDAGTQKINVYIPLKGLSMIDKPGGPFWWPEADAALFSALKANLRNDIPLIVINCNINDPAFSSACAEALFRLMGEDSGEDGGINGRNKS